MVGRNRSQRSLAWRAGQSFDDDRLSIPAFAAPSREYSLRLACRLVGAVILAHYLAIGANTGPFAMAGATIIFATTLVVAWLVTPDAHYWRGAWPAFVGLCIALFVAALPAIRAGDRERPDLLAPDLFAFGMIRMGAGMALLMAASWIGYRRGGLRLLTGVVVTAGAIDIAVGLLLREIDPRHVWGMSKGINTYRFTGTLLNANASGCIFGVTAILMAGLLRDALLHPTTYGLRALRPIFHTLLIVVAFGTCLITGSRTASALTLFALAAVWLVDARVGRTVSRRTIILFSGVGLLLLIAIILGLGSTTTDRIGLLHNDATQRQAIWAAVLDAARHAPWLGYGASSFDAIKDAAMYDPGRARLLWYVNSPHNIVIGMVLDHGVVFLAATILIALTMWPSFVRVWRERGHHPVGVSGLAACALIVSCASVDIALDVPAIMAIFLLLLGLLWGRGLRVRVELASSRSRGPAACGKGTGGRATF
jgi:O-antigen ligase